jgi:hypothetical protein
VQEIIQQAKDEMAADRRREAVESMKIRLARRPWWQKVFPFKISITRIKHV